MQLIRVRTEPSGRFTAQVVGLPELQASAATREEAVRQVEAQLQDWLASGQLVAVPIAWGNPLMQSFGTIDPNDPNEQAFLDELARMKREDLEQTLREYEQSCPSSSSTPTT
jgi:hypothetical protein